MRVTTQGALAQEDVDPLYALYLTALNPLLTQAAARHVLTRAEFESEMSDARIDKIVVRDDDDAPVAFTTLTTDLAAIPWVNPTYYGERFPDVVARGAMFYLGYVLVDPARRRSDALLLMSDLVNRRLSEAAGIIAFDICAFNVAYGVGRRTAQILHRANEVVELDTQTYYAADFRPVDTAQRPATPAQEAAGRQGALGVSSLQERPGLVDQIPALLDQLRVRAVRALRDRVEVRAVLAQVPAGNVLLLEDAERLRAAAIWLPLVWDGSAADVPASWADALARGLEAQRAGTGTAVVALPLVADADAAAAAVTAPLLRALRTTAATGSRGPLLTPVRPMQKSRYPLIELEDYLAWQVDGTAFDPVVRLHVSLGGRTTGVGAGPLTTASRERWSEALSLPLPGDGSYVFEGGLAPLTVRDGTGSYREPLVWMAYDAAPTPDRA